MNAPTQIFVCLTYKKRMYIYIYTYIYIYIHIYIYISFITNGWCPPQFWTIHFAAPESPEQTSRYESKHLVPAGLWREGLQRFVGISLRSIARRFSSLVRMLRKHLELVGPLRRAGYAWIWKHKKWSKCKQANTHTHMYKSIQTCKQVYKTEKHLLDRYINRKRNERVREWSNQQQTVWKGIADKRARKHMTWEMAVAPP